MKKIILFLITVVTFSSCYKDLGNYTYSDPEEIEISGIDSIYSVNITVGLPPITPKVKAADGAQLEYSWGYYGTEVTGVSGSTEVTNICNTLELDFDIPYKVTTLALVFKVTNKSTGYSKSVTSTLQINSDFSRAWYVFKSENDKADLDIYPTLTTKIENAFLLSNGRQLDGKAVKISFAEKYWTWSEEAGAYLKTRSLMLQSERDMVFVNNSNLVINNDFEGMFYEAPKIKSPSMFVNSGMSYIAINDGRMCQCAYMSLSTGKFTDTWLDDENSEYRLSKYAGSLNCSPMFFEEISGSFMTTNGSSMLTPLQDNKDSDLPCAKTNMNLLYLGVTKRDNYTAVLEDRDSKQQYIAKIVKSSWSVETTITTTEIASTAKIMNAERYTINSEETIIYFVADNGELWSYNLSNGSETKQYTPTQGEEITYIRHRIYPPKNDPLMSFNYVVVGLSMGDNYAVKMFTKTSGNLAAEPEVTLTGKGEVADVAYYSSYITDFSDYTQSY